jgi:hypothetical protein
MQSVAKELAEAILELIHKDPDIQRAIVDVVCSCPNIVLES